MTKILFELYLWTYLQRLTALPDLLVAKRHAYCLSMDAITFIFSSIRIKQGMKINDTENLFKILLSGVPQGSILGLILFNIFINGLLFFINEAKLINFTDDNRSYRKGT